MITRDNNPLLSIIQEHNYAILCEIDRVCRKNHIRYFLHGGTLLGAVRGGDFIPWDDDVDIVFPRKEYERFIDVFPKDFHAGYVLHDPRMYKEFFSFIASIADYSLMVPTQRADDDFYSKRYSHPMVDLFVFDEVGKLFFLQSVLLRVIYALATGHRKEIDYSHYSGIYKLGAYVLPTIGKIIPMKMICVMYKWIAIMGKCGRNGEYFISNEQPEPPHWGKKYKRIWFEKPRKAAIRKKSFFCANFAEDELAMMYGADYMKLPPKEKRRPDHFVVEEKEEKA